MSANNRFQTWMVFLEESDPVPCIEPREFATKAELEAYLLGVEDSARKRRWGPYDSEDDAAVDSARIQSRLMRGEPV